MFRALLLIALLLGWPAWAWATTLVSEDFEYADQTAMDLVWPTSCPGNPNILQLSTVFSISPTHSVRSVMDGGTNTCFMDRDYTGTAHVFYKWDVKFVNFNFDTDGNGSKQMYAKGPTFVFFHVESSRVWSIHVPYNGYLRTCPSGPGMPIGPQPNEECLYKANINQTPVNANGQYCVETEVLMSSLGGADGLLRMWVNGGLVLEYYNVPIVPSNHTGPMVFNNVTHYAQMGSGTRYIDDLIIADARIGCGVLSPTDTTPPAPVQGLAAVENVSGTGTITWQATTDSGGSGLASYTLVRCTGASCTPTVTLTNPSSSAVSYSDTGLSGSTVYGYAIRATDGAGNSTANSSPPVYITTNAQAAGALSLDAVSSSADNTTLGAVSWSHTIGSVNNRLLAVCTQARDANSTDANVGVSSVTFGGVALTQVPSAAALRSDSTNRYGVDLWYLIAPAIGTGTIAVTFGGTPSRYGVGSAISYSGVHQSTPIDATAVAATGSGTTLSAAITSATNAAMIMDCALGGDPLTIGSGQTSRVNRTVGVANASNDGAGVSTVAKATAGAETMDWTMGSQNWAMSTVVWKPTAVTVEPVITGLVLDATGADVTVGATAPTSYRVSTHVSNIIYAAASFPGGRFTAPGGSWPPAAQQSDRFVCIHPINASGVENILPSAYQCGVPPELAAIDTAVAVMTLSLPSAVLPFGTTSTTIALTLDKGAACRYAATDIAYSAMTLTMDAASLTRSATVGSLTTGTVHRYARCNFTDVLSAEHPNLTSLDITITVEASTADTTAPSTVGGLTATSLPNAQVQLDWTVATDNVAVSGYQAYLCQGTGCSTMLLTGLPVTNTQLIVALAPGLPYSFCVKAIDSSNNLSAACSTNATLTTSPILDLVPPSTMTNLRLYSKQTNSVVLLSDAGSDDKGAVSTIIELSTTGCAGTFNHVYTNLSLLAQINSLVPSTAYCARGLFSDGTNVSSAYSNTLSFTTAATGLTQPRIPTPFSQQRAPRVP